MVLYRMQLFQARDWGIRPVSIWHPSSFRCLHRVSVNLRVCCFHGLMRLLLMSFYAVLIRRAGLVSLQPRNVLPASWEVATMRSSGRQRLDQRLRAVQMKAIISAFVVQMASCLQHCGCRENHHQAITPSAKPSKPFPTEEQH